MSHAPSSPAIRSIRSSLRELPPQPQQPAAGVADRELHVLDVGAEHGVVGLLQHR
jgi:hypothetical protein